jgi:hypothetical protein
VAVRALGGEERSRMIDPHTGLPAAHPQRLTRLARALIWAFFTLQFVSLVRQVFTQWLGPEANAIGFYANTSSIAVCVLLGWAVRHVDRPGGFSHLPAWFAVWWWAVLAAVAAGVALGLRIYGSLPKFAALDAVPYLFILVATIMGAKPTVFRYARNVLFWMLLAAVLANAYAVTDFRTLAATAVAGDRVGVQSLAYETQATLAMWPLLLLLADGMPRWRAAVVFGAMVLFGALQILFQKRLGSAVVLLVLALYLWQSWRHRAAEPGPWGARAGGNRRVLAGVLLGATVLVVLFGRGLFLEQARSLGDRLTGASEAHYTQGFFSIFTLENERLKIVQECFQSFSPREWLIGRGMGGAFEWTDFDQHLLNTDRAAEMFARFYLPDHGYFGRREFEIGLFMPLLKGGLVLWLLVFAPVAAALLTPHHAAAANAHYSASYFTLLYLVLFLFLGGGFILADAFSVVIFGLTLGCCLRVAPRRPPHRP